MISNWLLQYHIRSSKFRGKVFKLLFSGSKLQIGRKFKCDSFPEISVTQEGRIKIGNEVLFRRNVEIRCHKNSNVIIEDNVRIDRGVRILATNNSTIRIKQGARIGLYSVLNGGDSITVGENSLISGFVYLQTSMHKYVENNPIQHQGFNHKPILLENDTWLGTHVVILPGVTIGKGSIIGSNAVVNSDVSSGDIMGGIPAKKLKSRFGK